MGLRRAVVNVATGERYIRGQLRLGRALGNGTPRIFWTGEYPAGSPHHFDVPFAFKAYALMKAAQHADLLLWCDSCILPVKPLEPLWEQIESDGYLIFNNGWNNYEWTATSAYPDLFPDCSEEIAVRINRGIKHVIGGCFGLNVEHPIGKSILHEYFRLASETRAFCGAWQNFGREAPLDVRGHRHDQTALSVLAWRFGCKLTDPPVIAYGKPTEPQDERTILLADGSYA